MIREKLANKNFDEKREIKSLEVVKALETNLPPKAEVDFSNNKFDIEIVKVSKLDKGVEVLARAWRTNKRGNKVQIGFGKDGSVDIERFRIFNVPILVKDDNGTIERKVRDFDEKGNPVVVTEFYREDPKQALLEAVQSTVAVKKQKFGQKNIVKGKIGSTTSTFYSGSGDGYVANSNANFATCRNASSGSSADHTSSTDGSNTQCSLFAAVYYMGRGFLPFDTSSLPDGDTIDSATFSLYTISNNNADSDTYEAVQTSQASTSSLTTADYDAYTNTSGGSRSIGSPGYQDITMNATGLTWIDKTGTSKLGQILGNDLNNTAPTGLNRDSYYFSEDSGTTRDPKLVVEHSEAAATGAPFLGINF